MRCRRPMPRCPTAPATSAPAAPADSAPQHRLDDSRGRALYHQRDALGFCLQTSSPKTSAGVGRRTEKADLVASARTRDLAHHDGARRPNLLSESYSHVVATVCGCA
jgi:hypothetical protein